MATLAPKSECMADAEATEIAGYMWSCLSQLEEPIRRAHAAQCDAVSETGFTLVVLHLLQGQAGDDGHATTSKQPSQCSTAHAASTAARPGRTTEGCRGALGLPLATMTKAMTKPVTQPNYDSEVRQHQTRPAPLQCLRASGQQH